MDSKLTDLIVRVETRARQLLLRYDEQQRECAQLRQLLQEREDEILSLQIKNEELQQRYDHLKMAKYIDMADDDVKDLRGRIRKMVRDVDRCISMLKVE